ncbi:MAG: UDP-N-acetyl-D-glucosamine dehydrogenase, partial [Proteobacteria bacterium]
IELIKELKAHGALVSYSDPYIDKFEDCHGVEAMTSVEASAENVASFDCILISTDHDAFSYKSIFENASLIVDTRGRYKESIGTKVFRA